MHVAEHTAGERVNTDIVVTRRDAAAAIGADGKNLGELVAVRGPYTLRMDTMNLTCLSILLALTLGSGIARGQDRTDSVATKPGMQADSSASSLNAQRKGNDKFIDEDGDGICDGRAKGLGLRHGAPARRGQGKDATTGPKKWRGGRK
jgi:hypothetical protein